MTQFSKMTQKENGLIDIEMSFSRKKDAIQCLERVTEMNNSKKVRNGLVPETTIKFLELDLKTFIICDISWITVEKLKLQEK